MNSHRKRARKGEGFNSTDRNTAKMPWWIKPGRAPELKRGREKAYLYCLRSSFLFNFPTLVLAMESVMITLSGIP